MNNLIERLEVNLVLNSERLLFVYIVVPLALIVSRASYACLGH